MFYRNQDTSHVRILHASPKSPAVDIYLNENLIIRNLPYKKFTEYLPVLPGTYNIKIFPTGVTTNPVIDRNINVTPNSIITVAAIGLLPNIKLLPILDPKLPKQPGLVNVRFVHLSPNAPSVDITLPDGKILFEDVEYKEITDYLTVKPGLYTFQVKPTGEETIVLTVPNQRLQPNRFYTIYAIGLVNDEPSLQLLTALDGNSYII